METNPSDLISPEKTAVLPDPPVSSSSRPMPDCREYKESDSYQWHEGSQKGPSGNQKADKNSESTDVPSPWSSVPSDKQYGGVPLNSTSLEYNEMETNSSDQISTETVLPDPPVGSSSGPMPDCREYKETDSYQWHEESQKGPSGNQKADKNSESTDVPSPWSSVPSDKQYGGVPLNSTSLEYNEMETNSSDQISTEKTAVLPDPPVGSSSGPMPDCREYKETDSYQWHEESQKGPSGNQKADKNSESTDARSPWSSVPSDKEHGGVPLTSTSIEDNEMETNPSDQISPEQTAVPSDPPVSSSSGPMPDCREYKESDSYQWHEESHKDPSGNQKAGKNSESADVPSPWSSVPSDKEHGGVPLTSTSLAYKEMETNPSDKTSPEKTAVLPDPPVGSSSRPMPDCREYKELDSYQWHEEYVQNSDI
ncbi:uncharacterized protein LOC110050641 isoform X2 [Orbicella faveolata]|uniref:uncharacterized protein LOC110050641 isoform X2 n=1 Tax=Orbicella faveolata TaxID=48498 RepID=UPI0009E513F6|nr:uncharacterized protein LOC110050641 isoform X2 [Orbicella faveolata]